MGYGDDNDIYISIVNLVITLMIIGVLLYLFLAYRDLKKRASTMADDYKKKFPTTK